MIEKQKIGCLKKKLNTYTHTTRFLNTYICPVSHCHYSQVCITFISFKQTTNQKIQNHSQRKKAVSKAKQNPLLSLSTPFLSSQISNLTSSSSIKSLNPIPPDLHHCFTTKTTLFHSIFRCLVCDEGEKQFHLHLLPYFISLPPPLYLTPIFC